MIRLTQRLTTEEAAGKALHTTLTLPIDLRIKSRLKVTLDNGDTAGLFLTRGQLLRGGEYLTDDAGSVMVMVKAAEEQVSTVRCDDPLLLSRICYHLGNRHVPLQIEASFARYQHDHVLDDMVVGLGGTVITELAPFEPEAGAYQSQAGAGHHHHHDHDHSHSHSSSHHHAESSASVVSMHGFLKTS
jgi:urease accessory protein